MGKPIQVQVLLGLCFAQLIGLFIKINMENNRRELRKNKSVCVL